MIVFRVVEFLLSKGADVNAEDEFSSARRMASRLRISPARGEPPIASTNSFKFHAIHV